MSQNIFLHVGLPKSGTSYVQETLKANREWLRSAGLLFPGASWVDQVRAVQDLREAPVGGRGRRQVAGAWERLAAEVAAWPGDAIISMEWLAAARPDHIRRLIDDLRPGNVQVIFTARDLARTIPAAWQEFMQNRDEWSWPDFLDGVVAADRDATAPGRRFWAQQDLPKLLGRWTEFVPRDQVYVVTLPHPGAGHDVLWDRMCTVLGDTYRACDPVSGSRNTSLGLESAELMRRLNRVAREDGLPRHLYQRAFKHGLAKSDLAGQGARGSKLLLPTASHDWVRDESARQIAGVDSSGVNVVGDLRDLHPVLEGNDGPQPQDVPDEVLLDLALNAMVAMARRSNPSKQAPLRRRLEEFERHPGRAALRIHLRAARARMVVPRRRRG